MRIRDYRPGDKDCYENRPCNYRYDDKSRECSDRPYDRERDRSNNRYGDKNCDRDDRRGDRHRPGQGDDYRRNRSREEAHTPAQGRDHKGKDEKRVTFERKYLAVESEPEPEPDPDGAAEADDEDEASLSDSSTFSERSQHAYITTMNGNITELPADPAFACGTCERSFPSKTTLTEHQLANCCISPQQAAGDEPYRPAVPSRCKQCKESFPSRNRLFQHLKACL